MLNEIPKQNTPGEWTLSGAILSYALVGAITFIGALPIIMMVMKDSILIYTHMFNYGGTYEENKKAYEEYKASIQKNPPKAVEYKDLDPLTQYMLDDIMGDMPYMPYNDH